MSGTAVHEVIKATGTDTTHLSASRDNTDRPVLLCGITPDKMYAVDDTTTANCATCLNIAGIDTNTPAELPLPVSEVIDFEREWALKVGTHRAGAKETAILAQFGGRVGKITVVIRYYQLLNLILDMPEALIHDPITVNRLRRIRDRGRRRAYRHGA